MKMTKGERKFLSKKKVIFRLLHRLRQTIFKISLDFDCPDLLYKISE